MSRSYLDQDTQIGKSFDYIDNLAAGSTLESSAVSLEDDANALRSQVNRILKANVSLNWYDDVPTVNAKKRGLYDLNFDLDDIEEKRLLFRTQILTDISVTAAQNWEVLSVAGSEAPSETAAVGVVTTQGAVVAFHTGVFGSHSLDEVAGANALQPKNLLVIRDATSGDPILSGGKQVWGLLQSEVATDGHTFNDTTQQVQISFVRENATADDLEACPVVDIAGKSINYSYVRRIAFDLIPEYAFLIGAFVDQSSSVDVTRQNAYDNQGTTPVDLLNNAILDIESAGKYWTIRDDTEAELFTITEGSAGGTSTVLLAAAVDVFDNNAVSNDFLQGCKFDTGGTEIDVGENAGVIETTSTNDLRLLGAGELYLDDGNQAGSSWAQTNGIKLSDTTAEWTQFETDFGEVSILNAMHQAYLTGKRTKRVAVVTAATIPADTNVTGAGGANIDLQLQSYVGLTFTTDVDIYLDGQLLRNGANAAANHDVYPGTTPANGDLMFEFKLHQNDVITMITWGL